MVTKKTKKSAQLDDVPSTWNHRVVKKTTKYIDPLTNKQKKEVYYYIEECYYDSDKENPVQCTEGLAVMGESLKDLEWTLKQMLKCLKHPIVNGDKWK
jgi:hypothetical protein